MPLGPDGQRVVIEALGEDPPDALAHHLAITPQPAPDPATLGPRDVVIAVRSAQVGWVDLLMASGQYQHLAEPPYTPGLEYSGEVLWVGAEARGVEVGDRVIADGFATGPRSQGPHRRQGGFATYAVAQDDAVIPLPENLDFDGGAALLGSYETATYSLVQRAQLRASETVLVHGASGATGLAAVHVAKRLGATVIATGRSPDKLAEVQAQGADHTICTADDAGGVRRFRDEVKALTGGRGAAVVYDGVGGPVSLETLRCLRFGARYLIVGWASTPGVAKGRGGRGAPNANQLPTNLILMKGLDVLGCPTVIATRADPTLRGPRLRRILDWVKRGEIVPHVSASWPLAAVREAMQAKWESRHLGGLVLHPADGPTDGA